ncbi:hypothetical protein K493DRAFT_332966 [Basidiobolus meristosporus CBS 931.73]|uniref:RanBP2-type domain-containing protein n=1 Tax=Basidiobolus meristosporus CBS 931.73 TaxID=1314790 RepID=A0A1Y1Z968_9FUNG|nr:hypothetical protein K493DRAFT_332966 [Basidiobolus meristosporus CBS 931.73]|eukprot:ORY06822.1 hypothetical protein K493DRAFT_332966 [Basidiobolus meristosporus CBS 931.73]
MNDTLPEDVCTSTNESKSQLLFANVSKEAFDGLTENHLAQGNGNDTNTEENSPLLQIQKTVNLNPLATTETEKEMRGAVFLERHIGPNDCDLEATSVSNVEFSEQKNNNVKPLQFTGDTLRSKSKTPLSKKRTDETASIYTFNENPHDESFNISKSAMELLNSPSVKVKYQRKKRRPSNISDKTIKNFNTIEPSDNKENVDPQHSHTDSTLDDKNQSTTTLPAIESAKTSDLLGKQEPKVTPKNRTRKLSKTGVSGNSTEQCSIGSSTIVTKPSTQLQTKKIVIEIESPPKRIATSYHDSSRENSLKRGNDKAQQNGTTKQDAVSSEKQKEEIESLPRKRRKSNTTVSNEACVTPSVSRNHPSSEHGHINTLTSSNRWSCSHCTYLNTPRAKKCTMCLKRRLPMATLKTMVPSPIMSGDSGSNQLANIMNPTVNGSVPKSALKKRLSFENQIVPSRGKHYLVHVLTTGLKDLQWQELQRSLDLLPQSELKLTIDDGHGFDENVTHVVTMTDENYICPRTFKYLCGVLVGKWLVNHNWIIDSITANEWLNEHNYEITGDTVMGITFGPKQGRRNSKKQLPRLFSNCKFYLHGDFKVPSKADLQKLITLGGARLLSRKPSQKYATANTQDREIDTSKPVIICDAKYPVNERANAWLKDFQLCTSTWLFNCISCYKLLDRDLLIDSEY